MFIRKKTLLNMIEVSNGEIASLKKRVLELEAFNTRKNIYLKIDDKEIGTITAEKICLASTEPISSFDTKGITVRARQIRRG